jgi:hypothetical protein
MNVSGRTQPRRVCLSPMKRVRIEESETWRSSVAMPHQLSRDLSEEFPFQQLHAFGDKVIVLLHLAARRQTIHDLR